MCVRGTPSRIQSDREEQLVAASKQVTAWDLKGVRRWAGRKRIEWRLVTNRLAALQRPSRKNDRDTQEADLAKLLRKQTATILQEAAQIINSRLWTGGLWAEGNPLSPEDLMLGKAGAGIPAVHFETGRQLVKRFRIV